MVSDYVEANPCASYWSSPVISFHVCQLNSPPFARKLAYWTHLAMPLVAYWSLAGLSLNFVRRDQPRLVGWADGISRMPRNSPIGPTGRPAGRILVAGWFVIARRSLRPTEACSVGRRHFPNARKLAHWTHLAVPLVAYWSLLVSD